MNPHTTSCRLGFAVAGGAAQKDCITWRMTDCQTGIPDSQKVDCHFNNDLCFSQLIKWAQRYFHLSSHLPRQGHLYSPSEQSLAEVFLRCNQRPMVGMRA